MANRFSSLRYLESMLAYRYSCLDDVVTWDDTDDPVAVTVRELERRGWHNGRVAIEVEKLTFFQVASYRKLQARFETLADGSGIIESARAVKSKQEIAYMRNAAYLTDLGVAAAIKEIREGSMDNDVAAGAFTAMTRAGSSI